MRRLALLVVPLLAACAAPLPEDTAGAASPLPAAWHGSFASTACWSGEVFVLLDDDHGDEGLRGTMYYEDDYAHRRVTYDVRAEVADGAVHLEQTAIQEADAIPDGVGVWCSGSYDLALDATRAARMAGGYTSSCGCADGVTTLTPFE